MGEGSVGVTIRLCRHRSRRSRCLPLVLDTDEAQHILPRELVPSSKSAQEDLSAKMNRTTYRLTLSN